MRIGISVLMSSLALVSGFFLWLTLLCFWVGDYTSMFSFFLFFAAFATLAWVASRLRLHLEGGK